MKTMLDVTTGKVKLYGVEVSPRSKIKDFEKYGRGVHICSRENGTAIVTVSHAITSNGIKAQAKIEINEKLDIMRILITPDVPKNGDMLECSRKWMKGMTDFNALFKKCPEDGGVSAAFPWGYICAMYVHDADYGTVDGDIHIVYSRLS